MNDKQDMLTVGGTEMDKVTVCTFTEGDFNFVGRVFKDLEAGLKAFQLEQGSYFSEYGAESAQEMMDFGYIAFTETTVEG